jgi:hypothetical protein
MLRRSEWVSGQANEPDERGAVSFWIKKDPATSAATSVIEG